MQKANIYIKDWLAIHPYVQQQPSDNYFIILANRLYESCPPTTIPDAFKKKLCLYTAAYLEDIISELGLWRAFSQKHLDLYGTPLPFYSINSDYSENAINEEDIRFIIWNTLAKAPYAHSYINPMNPVIAEIAHVFFDILDKEYETAPENKTLQDYFLTYKTNQDADNKLLWLFGHTYLTEPSVQEYIEQITPSDKFIIPCGPLALFLNEWLELLTENQIAKWQQIAGLFPVVPELSAKMQTRNKQTYELFTKGTNGQTIVYLNSYSKLSYFLTEVLQWSNDENHTLPQMKEHRNFIMMVNPEKGILLANDICEYISDPLNPMYDSQIAEKEAFQLLTIPMKCPPDLMEYLLMNGYLPDAQLPGESEKELVKKNADFIARHSLLYYYRGD